MLFFFSSSDVGKVEVLILVHWGFFLLHSRNATTGCCFCWKTSKLERENSVPQLPGERLETVGIFLLMTLLPRYALRDKVEWALGEL